MAPDSVEKGQEREAERDRGEKGGAGVGEGGKQLPIGER